MAKDTSMSHIPECVARGLGVIPLLRLLFHKQLWYAVFNVASSEFQITMEFANVRNGRGK